MLNFTGSALDIISGICFILSIVFAILDIGQVISILLLRSKAKKGEATQKDKNNKLMSFAGFFLLAAGFSSIIWIILCPILIITFIILSCYNVPRMEELITTGQITSSGAKKAKPVPQPVPQPEPEPEPVVEPEPEVHVMNEEEEQELVASLVRDEISIEEAHEALTDAIAVHFVEVEDTHSDKRHQSKAIINIDTLSNHFETGDTVTLEALKEKKLIPSKTDYIKVLAHGKLDKQLTVEAQDYSMDAVKMIILTGGKAIKKI